MKKRTKIYLGAGIMAAIVVVAALAIIHPWKGPGVSPGPPAYIPPPYQKILMDKFPVSLSALFWYDNLTEQASIMTGVSSGQTEQSNEIFDPYPYYTHESHSPATFKWYLYAHRPLAISFPVNTTMEVVNIRSNLNETINGTIISVNIEVVFYLNYYISITLDHSCLNYSLLNEWQTAPASSFYNMTGQFVPIPANTIIGYTDNVTALDYIVSDLSVFNYGTTLGGPWGLHDVNPYFYFTKSVQAELVSNYSVQYDAMEKSGLFIEGALNQNFTINEAGRFFGAWFYESGYLPLNSSDHLQGWYGFNGGILDILDVNQTDNLTFYKDKNTGLPFNSSMVGVYYDAQYGPVSMVPGYDPIGGKYMYFQQGNFVQGIVRLDNFFENTRPGPIYMKYQLIPGNASMYSDLLRVDYFSNLSAAEGPFSADNLTYARIYSNE
jgi:hypothetical protein